MTTWAAGQNTEFESQGRAVNVTLAYNTDAKHVAYVEGWLGITNESGASGDTVALTVDRREYQFSVPSSLTVHKGDIVYVDVTDLTGHVPDDTAYSTTSSGSNKPLFKATAEKASNNVVSGILLQVQA